MTISRLYQRAHRIRTQVECMGKNPELPATPHEFFVGVAIGEKIDHMRSANGEILLPRMTQIHMVTMVLRGFAHKPAALRRQLLECLRWPEDWARVWRSLLGTYGEEPELLLAIADGMEA